MTEQVLQRQCGGLQTAVSSMELEVEGNTQGVMAMKNRVRLFRKESRKQVKIVARVCFVTVGSYISCGGEMKRVQFRGLAA